MGRNLPDDSRSRDPEEAFQRAPERSPTRSASNRRDAAPACGADAVRADLPFGSLHFAPRFVLETGTLMFRSEEQRRY